MKTIFDEKTQQRIDYLLEQRSLHQKKLDEIDAQLFDLQDYDPDYFKVNVPAFAQNIQVFEKIKEIYVERATIEGIDRDLNLVSNRR